MFICAPALMARSGGPETDPFFSNVSLLLHFDGANDSTVFTDSSSSPKTITRTNTARLSNVIAPKFGTASLYLGDDQSRLDVPTNGFPMGTEDFTLECWYNAHSTPAGQYKILASKSGQFNFERKPGGGIGFFLHSGSLYMSGGSDTTFAWYHAAVTRQGNTFRLFFNGTLVGTLTSSVNWIAAETGRIGMDIGANASDWHGNIDEFRVTRGVCRYTASFTPPTAAFPNA